MIYSFLKKQRKPRERPSPPPSPASFYSPNLERSPDLNPPPLPPLPTLPASTSSAASSPAFPYGTRFPWPPSQAQSQSQNQSQSHTQTQSQSQHRHPSRQPSSQPHPVNIPTAATSSTSATAAHANAANAAAAPPHANASAPNSDAATPPRALPSHGLGSPEIQLDLGFTSESLLDGFPDLFDRRRSVALSSRTGIVAPAPAASEYPLLPRVTEKAGASGSRVDPPDTTKPTPPTPTPALSPAASASGFGLSSPPVATSAPTATSFGSPASAPGSSLGAAVASSFPPASTPTSRTRPDHLQQLAIRIPPPSASKALPVIMRSSNSNASMIPRVPDALNALSQNPQNVSNSNPSTPPKATSDTSKIPDIPHLTAPSPKSPHAPTASTLSLPRRHSRPRSPTLSTYSLSVSAYSDGASSGSSVYSASDGDSGWSYASAPDLDWGLSPGGSYAPWVAKGDGWRSGEDDNGEDLRSVEGAGDGRKRRRTSTGSTDVREVLGSPGIGGKTEDLRSPPVGNMGRSRNARRDGLGNGTRGRRARNSHRLTRQDSATLPFDVFVPMVKGMGGNAGEGTGRKARSRHNSKASLPRNSRHSKRASRHSKVKSRGSASGSVPGSASASRPNSPGLSASFGSFSNFSAGGLGMSMTMSPVAPMPEGAAEVVRASLGAARSGSRHKSRSIKARSPGIQGTGWKRPPSMERTPPVPGSTGASPGVEDQKASSSVSAGVDPSGVRVVNAESRKTATTEGGKGAVQNSETATITKSTADAEVNKGSARRRDSDTELTLEDVLTGEGGFGKGVDMRYGGMGEYGMLGVNGSQLGRVGVAERMGSSTGGTAGQSASNPNPPHTAGPMMSHSNANAHRPPIRLARDLPRDPVPREVSMVIGRSQSARPAVGVRHEGSASNVTHGVYGGAAANGGASSLGLSGMSVALGRNASATAALGGGVVRPLPMSPDPPDKYVHPSPPLRPLPPNPTGRVGGSENAEVLAGGGTGGENVNGNVNLNVVNGIRATRSPSPLPPLPGVYSSTQPSQFSQPSESHLPPQRSPHPSHPLTQEPSHHPIQPPAPAEHSAPQQQQQQQQPSQSTSFDARRSFSAPSFASGGASGSGSGTPDASSTVTLDPSTSATSIGSAPLPIPGSATAAGMRSASPGVLSASPGMLSASPGMLSASPGIRSASPGVRSASPGIRSASPGVRSASPGIRSASPMGGKFMHPPRPVYSPWNRSTGDVSQAQSPGTDVLAGQVQRGELRRGEVQVSQVQVHVPKTPSSANSSTSNYSTKSASTVAGQGPAQAETSTEAGVHGSGVRRMSANQVAESRGTSPAPSNRLSGTSRSGSVKSVARGTLPVGISTSLNKPSASAVERLQQRARADSDARRASTAPQPSHEPLKSIFDKAAAARVHHKAATDSLMGFPETPHEFSPLCSPSAQHPGTVASPSGLISMPSRSMTPKAPLIDPAPPPKRRSRPPLPIGPRKPSVRVGGVGLGQPSSLGTAGIGQVPGASSSSVSLGATNMSASGPGAGATTVAGGASVRHSNSGWAGKGMHAPPSPKFQTRPVRWRGLTMDAAKWTLTSGQLQDIVGRAIRQSAEASSIRLLTLEVLDKEIPEEIRRLETLRDEIKSKYRGTVRRRRVLFRSLYAERDDAQTQIRPSQELIDVSIACDQLTEELFRVMDELQQLNKLRDVHSASALAMALRKLNSSFLKQTTDMQELSKQMTQLEAEREDAWATAERVEQDLIKLQSKMEALNGVATPGSTSNRSSRVSAARKTSIRASKASLRISRGARSSHSSISSQRLSSFGSLAPMPPVPPVPRIAYTPSSQSLWLNTDIPVSAGSPYSMSISSALANSPTAESRALAEAQNDLYNMLGISRADLRRTRSGKTRPVSELLSPNSVPGSPFPLHSSGPLTRTSSEIAVPSSGRRRNASFSAYPRPADSMYGEIAEI